MSNSEHHDNENDPSGALEGPEIWERQEGESALWYDRLHRFMLLGPERSLLALYRAHRRDRWEDAVSTGGAGAMAAGGRAEKGGRRRNRFKPPSSVPNSWERQADAWYWRERAEEFDAHERRRREDAWRTRQDRIREREWEQADKLLDRADRMLNFPLMEREVERVEGPDGVVHITTVKPAGWRLRDVALLLRTASDIARRATGLDNDGASPGRTFGDLSRYSTEQLRLIAAGKDPGPPEYPNGAPGG